MNGKSKVLADETFCFISLFTEISWWDLIASNRLVCVYDIDKENVKMKESNNVCPFMAHFYVMLCFLIKLYLLASRRIYYFMTTDIRHGFTTNFSTDRMLA